VDVGVEVGGNGCVGQLARAGLKAVGEGVGAAEADADAEGDADADALACGDALAEGDALLEGEGDDVTYGV
jgi:hypothetical protein